MNEIGAASNYPLWRLFMDGLTFAFALYIWWSARKKAAQQDVTDLKTDVVGVKTNMYLIEERMNHLPSREDLRRLHQRVDDVREDISGLSGGVQNMRGTVEATSRAVSRVEDYLLNERKKNEL